MLSDTPLLSRWVSQLFNKQHYSTFEAIRGTHFHEWGRNACGQPPVRWLANSSACDGGREKAAAGHPQRPPARGGPTCHATNCSNSYSNCSFRELNGQIHFFLSDLLSLTKAKELLPRSATWWLVESLESSRMQVSISRIHLKTRGHVMTCRDLHNSPCLPLTSIWCA